MKAKTLMTLLWMPALALGQNDPTASTPTGFGLAIQASDYRYAEPRVVVSLEGRQAGARGTYARRGDGGRVDRLEMRLAYGEIAYRGSGNADDQPNLIVETRYLVGREYLIGPVVGLMPFAGIGYRYLYSDLRGETSVGAVGYRRHSNYLYLPIGLAQRYRTGEGWVVAPTVEFDYFIRGRQYSHLSDTGIPGFADTVNTQRRGHGYRASLRFESRSLHFGPWFQYWKIADSDVAEFAPGRFGLEPENTTREVGFELGTQF
jgi:hypothetical protein